MLRAKLPEWLEFRRNRSITSHTYNEEKAQEIFESALDFLQEAPYLLNRLHERNEPLTSPVDIRPDQLETVQDILLKHLPAGVRVWVFGSRANWTTKDASDLDLALEGKGQLNHKMLGTLKDAFENSALPYAVDVVDLNRIGRSFKESVESQRVPLPLDGYGTRQAPSDGWRKALWGELATLEYGNSLRDYDTPTGLYKVYGTNGPIGRHSEPLCPYASVIIGRKGAYRGVHYSPDPFFVIDTAFYLKPKVELDTRWAYFQLLTQDINGMDSGSAIPSTSRVDFYGLPVDVPPLPEQRAIAHILGTLDDKIKLNRRMNETLEQMARALFRSWFVDFDPVRAKMEGRWRRGESLLGLPRRALRSLPGPPRGLGTGEDTGGMGGGTIQRYRNSASGQRESISITGYLFQSFQHSSL